MIGAVSASRCAGFDIRLWARRQASIANVKSKTILESNICQCPFGF
jgi:hypothetical protein